MKLLGTYLILFNENKAKGFQLSYCRDQIFEQWDRWLF